MSTIIFTNFVLFRKHRLFASYHELRKLYRRPHILLSTKIFPRESTRHIPLPEKNISLPTVKSLREPQLKFVNTFPKYDDDSDLTKLIELENMFVSFDKLDFQILLYFMKGATNTEIANRI